MDTRELIELLYQTYNPKTSQTEKLGKDPEKLKLESTTI
jgi:hypothetical protein